MSKNILYIGNNLVDKTKYISTMTTLSSLLGKEGYKVTKSSNRINKLSRILHMISSVLSNVRTTDYVLIDTFSTINFYYAFTISQLCRLLHLKYIPILHGGNLPYRLEKSSYLSRLIFNNSYSNVAPSNYLKSAFEKKGFEVKFIPNVLEIENYVFKIRERVKPKILWVRAFKHLYNPKLAIDVLIKVQEKYPEATLCMIGPFVDDSFDLVRATVSDNNLDDYVEFTGVLSKEEWHKKSESFDIFINTTNFDNTPVSIMEAMALGIPVVSTNVGGMPFLIEHMKDGILVGKNDSNQMAKAIIDMVEKSPKEMIVKARNKAESFSWNNVKSKWIDLLN